MKLRPFLTLLLLSPAVGILRGEQDPHWAFQLLQKPTLPSDTGDKWSTNEIDLFTLKALEEAGLQPNPQADALTLIRRLTLDLTGLPPTLEELQQFEAAVDRRGLNQSYQIGRAHV